MELKRIIIMKRKIFAIVLILSVSMGIYLYIDGMILYKIQKAVLPPLKLIEYYTERKFPEGTELNSIEFYPTDPPYTEYLEAVVMIPEYAIDDLFSEKERQYDDYYRKTLPKDEQQKFSFCVHKYIVSRRLTYSIRSGMSFEVLEPETGYIKMYVSVGNLGAYRQY